MQMIWITSSITKGKYVLPLDNLNYSNSEEMEDNLESNSIPVGEYILPPVHIRIYS
jgi:hypothetical protein